MAISYNTPIRPCDETYFGLPNFSTTHLPQNTALIRAVAIETFAAFICLTTTIWCWPVLLIATAFAGWTIYSNMLRPDPLVEAFYQIVGGKAKFDALPTLDLSNPQKLTKNIDGLDWDKLDSRVYRAKTTDGRQVLILKALSKEVDPEMLIPCPTKTIFAFVEKLGSNDFSYPAIATLFDALSFKGNTAGTTLSSCQGSSTDFYGKESNWSRKFVVFSSISNELANEIKEQLAISSIDCAYSLCESPAKIVGDK